jgi:hypothetical protein
MSGLGDVRTIFECRCCARYIGGLSDGRFDHDDDGQWGRIDNIDGPNAVCPRCVSRSDCLDDLIADGYENARILVGEDKQ